MDMRLFFLSIALLGLFNDFPLFPTSATFRSPSAVLFALVPVSFVIASATARSTRAIRLRREYLFLAAILSWIVVSFGANYFRILQLDSREITGIDVFLRALGLLSLNLAAVLITASCLPGTAEEVLRKARQYMLISFLIVFPYALLEVIYYLTFASWAGHWLALIDPFVHARRGSAFLEHRVRGLAFEASYFGVYCSVVLPWLLSYLFQSGSKRIWIALLLVFFVVFVVLSQSRTAYVVTVFEAVVYVALAYWYGRGSRLKLAFKFAIVAAICVAAVVVVSGGTAIAVAESLLSNQNDSNLTRLASQQASFEVGMANPAFGVGLGLAGAYVPDYYPSYAWEVSRMPFWASERARALASPSFGLFAGVVAELGIPALIGLLGIVTFFIFRILKYARHKRRLSGKTDVLGIALLVSSLGVFAASFGLQGYTFAGYWLLSTLALVYSDPRRHRPENLGSDAPRTTAPVRFADSECSGSLRSR